MTRRRTHPRPLPPDPPAVRRSVAIGGCDGVASRLPGRPIDLLMWNAAVCATLPTNAALCATLPTNAAVCATLPTPWVRAGATIGP